MAGNVAAQTRSRIPDLSLGIPVPGAIRNIYAVTGREADLRPLLNNFSVTFLFIGPFLTMRLLAEEARTGTLELLLTQPLRDAELVIGKYLGSVVFLLFLLAMTL